MPECPSESLGPSFNADDAPRRLLRRIENPHHGRYLTFSCYRRLALFQNDRIKQAFVDRLVVTRGNLKFRLIAWVIMPEHVHLLIRTGRADLSVEEVLNTLKSRFARQVLAKWNKVNAPILPRVTDARGDRHFWQVGGGYDRNLVSQDEWVEKITYMHNNPVRRGLVRTPIDWPWSSARWYAGDRSGSLVMDPI